MGILRPTPKQKVSKGSQGTESEMIIATEWLSTQTEGALVFAGCSTGGKGGWKKRGYQNDVDYFAVYGPDTNRVYLVPAEGIGNQCSLRLTPSKNKQEKHVRYAADYEL